jgi:hypothetical protein
MTMSVASPDAGVDECVFSVQRKNGWLFFWQKSLSEIHGTKVCVCLLLQDLVQSCVRGEGGDVAKVCVCLLLQDLVQSKGR